MEAGLARATRARLWRHGGEITAITLVCAVMAAVGVVPDEIPFWVTPLSVVVGSLGIVAVFARWAPGTARDNPRARIVAHTGMLSFITYATGWGFALPLVHLFAVADNVRHGSSRDVPVVISAAAGWTVVSQLALTVGAAPNVHTNSILDTWVIAAFMVVCVNAVAGRIRRVAAKLEDAQDEIAASERRFRSLVEDSSDVILLIQDGMVVYESPSTERVLGRLPGDPAGRTYLDFVHPDDRDVVIRRVQELVLAPEHPIRVECRLRHAAGHWIVAETSARRMDVVDLDAGFVVNVRDVTERRELEAELEHQAFHDPLTGLPNRLLFRDRAEQLVARTGRTHRAAAALYLDLDGFKDINDSLGHTIGDRVLELVADRLRQVIRDADTAARLGGDEYAILLEELQAPEDAAATAQRVVEALREPFVIDAHTLDVSASVGVALLEPDDAAEDLIRNADIAMYEAKSAGRGEVAVFQHRMHAAVVERLALEQDLRRGIARGELRVHYQPIVTVAEQRVVGFEALVRWEHPERGMVSPVDFIPLAEESGAIVELGRHVLETAAWQAREWQRRFATQPPLSMSVNVSMRQLQLGDVVSDVRDVLERTGIDPSTLTLELTESAFISDVDHAMGAIDELAALGVGLAIDDFGTGYSSLSYLQRFPLHTLKIDRSFVAGMADGSQSPTLVRAIVAMSQGLRLRTVAEGIETERERALVEGLGCDLGQGWLFARPASAEEMSLLLHEDLTTASPMLRLAA